MKRLFLQATLLVVFSCTSGFGQWLPTHVPYPVINQPGATLRQVIDTLAAHSSPIDTVEGGVQSELASFELLWRARVNLNDNVGQNMFQQYSTALGSAVYARTTTSMSCSGSGFTGAWEPGPDNLSTQTSGYVNAIWAGSGVDSNILLTGSIYLWPGLGAGGFFGSGLFKSIDGGITWNNITDNAAVNGIISVEKIAVNPLDVNTIFIATGSTSLLKSFDGGIYMAAGDNTKWSKSHKKYCHYAG